MDDPMDLVAGRPALETVIGTVVRQWPVHAKFLAKGLSVHGPAELDFLEEIARDVLALTGNDLEIYCRHYRWMCDVFTKEALYFLRNGEYRCKTFADAEREVYANREFMNKYMDGLLVSQLLWANHAQCALHYRREFLPRLVPGFRYLEIGPGHGMFLAQAARDPRVGSATAWDVSAESISQTRAALGKLQVPHMVRLEQRNVYYADLQAGPFDAIVISEVLEHLEDPQRALRTLRRCVAPSGLLLVNVPINSPAPDHIYLLRKADEAVELVRSSGFDVIKMDTYPMTGYTLPEAEEKQITISCMLIGKPAFTAD